MNMYHYFGYIAFDLLVTRIRTLVLYLTLRLETP